MVPGASHASTSAGAPSTRAEVMATAKQIAAKATIGRRREMCCHFGLLDALAEMGVPPWVEGRSLHCK
jgi:hypothetical protein